MRHGKKVRDMVTSNSRRTGEWLDVASGRIFSLKKTMYVFSC